MTSAFEIEVIKNKDSELFFACYRDRPIRNPSGKHIIEHPSEKFIADLVYEIQSFGDIEINDKSAVEPEIFSLYTVYSDYLEKNLRLIYLDCLNEIIFTDMTFQTVAGHEQIDQLNASEPVMEFVKEIVGKEIETLHKITHAYYYECRAFMSRDEAEDPELYGKDTYITRDLLINTEFFDKLKSSFSELTEYEVAAVHGLYGMCDQTSFFAAFAYVSGKISKNEYATSVLASQALRHGVFGDIDRDEYGILFQDQVHNALVAETFLELGDPTRSAGGLESLIRNGESEKVEFKATFTKNIENSRKDRAIRLSSIKTVAGFLNAKGGTLLIGVTDSQDVYGIENDFFSGDDKYLLQVNQILDAALGPTAIAHVRSQIRTFAGKKVCVLECEPSDEAVFCSYHTAEGTFFLRQGPLTKSLTPEELFAYQQSRTARG